MDKSHEVDKSQERKLYKRAIELVNGEFEKLGLHPTIGVEFEFYISDEMDKKSAIPVTTVALDDIRRDIRKELANLQGLAFHHEPISALHREKDTSYLYEVSTNPFLAEKSVDNVEAVLASVRRHIEALGDRKTSLMPLFPGQILPALHTSIGFMAGGKDAFNGTSDKVDPSPAREQIAEHMKPALLELMLLFAQEADSYTRFTSNPRSAAPREISLSQREAKNKSGVRVNHDIYYPLPPSHSIQRISHRIENRLPGADTPVYKAILGTMLAALDAVKQSVELDEHGQIAKDPSGRLACRDMELPPDYPLPATIAESAKAFQESRRLWDTLDWLSPQEKIGTQIFEQEMERYNRMPVKEGHGAGR